MILINHTCAPVRKERLSPTSKVMREANRNMFMKKAGCQTESKALEKSIAERIVREMDWVCQTHPKWTSKGTEFDQE